MTTYIKGLPSFEQVIVSRMVRLLEMIDYWDAKVKDQEKYIRAVQAYQPHPSSEIFESVAHYKLYACLNQFKELHDRKYSKTIIDLYKDYAAGSWHKIEKVSMFWSPNVDNPFNKETDIDQLSPTEKQILDTKEVQTVLTRVKNRG